MNAEGTIAAWKNPAKRRRIPAHPRETNAKGHKAYKALWNELLGRANEIVIKINVLRSAIEQKRWFAALRHAMNLERAVIRLDLAFKMAEPNARLGRARRENTRAGGAVTGSKTTHEASKRQKYAVGRNQDFELAGRPLNEAGNIAKLTKDIERKFKKPIRPSTTKRYVRKSDKRNSS
jgi:hypothetical protein